jgi:hypothetical protein
MKKWRWEVGDGRWETKQQGRVTTMKEQYHLPPASQATAHAVDHKWIDDNNR